MESNLHYYILANDIKIVLFIKYLELMMIAKLKEEPLVLDSTRHAKFQLYVTMKHGHFSEPCVNY